jgi:hypothetical protein
VQVDAGLLDGGVPGPQDPTLSLRRHARAQHPADLGIVGSEVEGEQPDGEHSKDCAHQAAHRAEQVTGVVLQVLGDLLGGLPRPCRAGDRHHGGVEVLLGVGVELADPDRQLLGDLVDLTRQHRAHPNAEHHEQRQEGDQEQRGRAAAAPSPPLVQPGHGRFQPEREQLGEDQVAQQVAGLSREPQRGRGEQHGSDQPPDPAPDRGSHPGRHRRPRLGLVRTADTVVPSLALPSLGLSPPQDSGSTCLG